MIVVCTGCSAKFKVADEKVGPKGAKLRCSKCQAVFTVRREEAPVPVPVPPPLPSSRRATPAPRSADVGAPVDARAAFEIDLEPAASGPGADPDPFAPSPPGGPFAASPSPAAGEAPPPPDDPFGAGVAGPDPFADPLPPLAGLQPSGDLALEERTTPPARNIRPQSSAPFDDPFGGPVEAGGLALDAGHPGDIPPLSNDLPGEPFGGFSPGGAPDAGGEPTPAPPPRREAPLRVDPFAAAAVDADPLQVAPSRGPVASPGPAAASPPPDQGAGAAAEPAGALTLARLRAAAINAVSLLALLGVALALLVIWHGNVPLAEAFNPPRLLAALTHRGQAPAPFAPRHVTSGLFERARGAPLLFVRGEVVSSAPAAVAGVRVAVELVRDGAVLARAEALAGGLLSPEELFAVADAAALARAAEGAAARAPGPVQPGQALPFLVALAEYPGDLAGVALRVRADGEPAR